MQILDEYTGRVDVAGPAACRNLSDLMIIKISVGPLDNNAYLLVCQHSGEALLIDAASEAERLSELVTNVPGQPHLKTIVTTHNHADHWQALEVVAGAFKTTTVAHSADASSLPVTPDRSVDHGDTVTVGNCQLEVLHLPGHTPGSIALLYRDPQGHPHLFTGDALFPGGLGRTSSKEEFETLLTAVDTKVFKTLPDDTWFYPGHGDDSTLGAERPNLGEWASRGW